MKVVDSPHIPLEVAVSLVVEQNNLSSLQVMLTLHLRVLKPHRLLLASGSSTVETRFDFQSVSWKRLGPEELELLVSTLKVGMRKSSHMSPIYH